MNITRKYEKLQQVMEEYAEFVYSSARAVLSFIDISGKNIVDFGCGRGDWLHAAKDAGANEILGLETYALERSELDIPVRSADLTKPVSLGKTYDIALCLEVGEHLEEQYAATLVQSLVNSAPLIVFSAAAPGQGGVGHVNEQPPVFWHALFTDYGYECHDFRLQIWSNEAIEPWYKMGALVYCRAGTAPPELKKYRVDAPLHLIHPEIFEAYAPKGNDVILHYNKAQKRWYPEILN